MRDRQRRKACRTCRRYCERLTDRPSGDYALAPLRLATETRRQRAPRTVYYYTVVYTYTHTHAHVRYGYRVYSQCVRIPENCRRGRARVFDCRRVTAPSLSVVTAAAAESSRKSARCTGGGGGVDRVRPSSIFLTALARVHRRRRLWPSNYYGSAARRIRSVLCDAEVRDGRLGDIENLRVSRRYIVDGLDGDLWSYWLHELPSIVSDLLYSLRFREKPCEVKKIRFFLHARFVSHVKNYTTIKVFYWILFCGCND